MTDTDLRELLARPALEVAPRLLGARLTIGGVTARLTEVEAYEGADDPGSHAHRGPTPRNEVMFGPPGHLYVYFTYGMHHCCNIACGPEGRASAVLLRAGEIVTGVETARARRPGSSERDLARGPARLCRALDIDRTRNGLDLLADPATLEIASTRVPATEISRGPRVGLRLAAERPWRFWLSGDPTVSRYVAAKPRPSVVR